MVPVNGASRAIRLRAPAPREAVMSNVIRLLPCLALTALVSACTSVPVQQDYDPSFDFSVLGSYAWFDSKADPEKVDLNNNQLVSQRIVRAVDQKMASKGYRLTTPDQASFLISHHIAVDKQLRIDTTNWGYGYGYYGWGGGYSDTRVRQYDVGTLILDFITPGDQKDLLWRGTGSSNIQDSRTPEERERVIQKVVDAILDQFPPKKS
jgi:hypothetical protein